MPENPHPFPHADRDAANRPNHDYWQGVKSRTAAGWDALMPNSPPEMQREGLADILQAQLRFLPVTVLWNDLKIVCSLDDGQASNPLQEGGSMPSGQVTLYFTKDDFSEVKPKPHDEMALMVSGKWQRFLVSTTSEGFDESDPGFIVVLEPPNA
jgi:hypothetical protein